MDNRDEALSLELGKIVNFSCDLPEMIFFESECTRYYFFERPVFSYRDLVRKLCERNLEIYQSMALLTFGKPTDSWSRQYVETGSDDFADQIVTVAADFGAGELGFPIILSNLTLDWVLYESATEDLAVMQIRVSTKAAAFIAAVAELDPIGCEHMTTESPRYPLLRETFGILIDVLRSNYCGHECIQSSAATA